MKRKYIYPVLVALVTVGFYYGEQYIDRQQAIPKIVEGKKKKITTNTYFLPSSTTGAIVHHNFYSLSYSEKHEQAEWVAYELKEYQVSNKDQKRPYFEIDNAVPTKAASWKNYNDSGYDRGHLCPAADRKFTKEAYDETFLTSNIAPQDHDFNAGVWADLERQVRYWAKRYKGVFVVTGGVLQDDLPAIGSEKVAVPKYFYKVVLDNNAGNTRMIGFLFPHKATDRPIKDFVVAVDRIERLTGIDFFPQLEDGKEQRLERNENTNQWKF